MNGEDQRRVWELGELQGPRQKSNNYSNCGVYVSWVLGALIRGIYVSEESVMNLLRFRKEILHMLRDAPQHLE